MSKIAEIIDSIYDTKIEDPKRQTLMRSCIKAWLRDAVMRGIVLGRSDLAIELETTIKKAMHPDMKVLVFGKDL